MLFIYKTFGIWRHPMLLYQRYAQFYFMWNVLRLKRIKTAYKFRRCSLPLVEHALILVRFSYLTAYWYTPTNVDDG